jgi:hypothetical protein
MHSIRTHRRKAFYWLAILVTFATGTAVGDLIAEKFSLGSSRRYSCSCRDRRDRRRLEVHRHQRRARVLARLHHDPPPRRVYR